MKGLGWCVLISDFLDLLTSDGVAVGNMVPVRLEREFFCFQWERLGPRFDQGKSEQAREVGQAWAGGCAVASGPTLALASPLGRSPTGFPCGRFKALGTMAPACLIFIIHSFNIH